MYAGSRPADERPETFCIRCQGEHGCTYLCSNATKADSAEMLDRLLHRTRHTSPWCSSGCRYALPVRAQAASALR